MNNEIISFKIPGARKRLILLHGWGADAADLLPLGSLLNQISKAQFELVLFQAPHKHPQGIGRQWFSLYPHDWEAVPKERESLKTRIKGIQTKEIPLDKTVLIGFSQGAAMALTTGCEMSIAGIIACSGFRIPNWTPPLNRPPILLTHGRDDNVVESKESERLLELFKISNQSVTLELFEGSHEIPNQLINKFLSKINYWLD